MKESFSSAEEVSTPLSELSTMEDASSTIPQPQESDDSRKRMLRCVLIVSLVAAVSVCSTMSYLLLKDSEEQVGRATYESIAQAALSNAQAVTQRKLQGSEVMATLLSEILTEASDWPLVDIAGYIPIAAKVAELSSSNTQSLMVFLEPSQVVEFEQHMQQVYVEQGRPEGTGYQDFGFGIYKSDRNDPPLYEDGRVPDTDGSTDWGGRYNILAPLTLHNIPGAGSLLYNTYSDENRGIHLESMKDCVAQSVTDQLEAHLTTGGDLSSFQYTTPKCPVITDMLELQIRPGPAGLLFNPVFPASDPTQLVAFATTSIHWQEVLEAVVPDYVSGLSCVVTTATSSYTYEIRNGYPELVGFGDQHTLQFEDMGRSVILNNIETGTATSAVYTLSVYPTDDFFKPFQSNSPMAVSLGFAGAIMLCALLFIGYDFLVRREANERKTIVDHLKRENRRHAVDNSMWKVRQDELEFEEPAAVLGQGTFGLVLLAQYRGTNVAVKRVIPPKQKNEQSSSEMFATKSTEIDGLMSSGPNILSSYAMKSGLGSWADIGMSRVPRSSGSKSKNGQSAVSDMEYEELKKQFVEEMRHLSRLRHPCITTVMGAVIEEGVDPMLILEYMDHGSLHDILHNDTMAIDGEIALPILRDISQGMRFLHSANPQVFHGDLKAQNILVDGRFRAKVADFGLSQKKSIGGTGTPYWMAPELLRKESANTSASDVFSFGVILYEVYSRRDPYPGENASDVLRDIMDKTICKRVKAPDNMPAQIKLLMDDCMQEDPEKRPSFEEIDLRLKRVDAETVTPSGSKRKAQVSLFDIFPRHIAEALRDGRNVEAEHHELVTIFFSDIVGFTEMSANMEPHKVANMLDRLYSQLDSLTNKYDCYKIETIGDAFMAATNLVKDQSSDHCKRIAKFAIEAIEVANRTPIDTEDPSKGCISIRVGFHSGPVVADVVGHRNPRYCLFGDAVNVSARMESNSECNRINCSDRSAQILKEQWPQVTLIDRNELYIKGKGLMRCFWVHSGTGSTTMTSTTKTVEGIPEQRPEQPRPTHSIKAYKQQQQEANPLDDFVDLEKNLISRLRRVSTPNSSLTSGN
eukprot:scaffold1982_cov93-Amphora_coffeaeformis.AAC.45